MSCDLCGSAERDPHFEKNGARYVRCRHCGFVHADCDGAAAARSNEEFFDEAFDRYVEKAYSSRRQRVYAQRLRRFERWRVTNRLLEVGANTGGFLYRAQKMGWQATGVELVDRCAAHARDLGLDVRTGSIDDVPLPSATFDVVYANAVMEHLPSPRRALLRIADALRPGGVVVFDTVNVESWTARIVKIAWKLVDPVVHPSLFGPRTAREFCRRSGLRVLALRTHGVRLRPNAAPRLRGLERLGEELVKLPLSAACRILDTGDAVAVVAQRPA